LTSFTLRRSLKLVNRNAQVIERLQEHGIQPSAQRVAVAQYALNTEDHPSADEVWERVKRTFPMLSRATVYNTLNLFVEKGLLQALVIAEGKVVFDPKTDRHHHFVDDETGAIHDIPWETLEVKNVQGLKGFQVREYQVILHGRQTQGR
jgi:Fur family transcriptional regulator, iron response regulator